MEVHKLPWSNAIWLAVYVLPRPVKLQQITADCVLPNYPQGTLGVFYSHIISHNLLYFDCRIMHFHDQSNYSELHTSKIHQGTLRVLWKYTNYHNQFQFDWQFMCSQDLLNYSRLPQIVYFQNTLKVPYGYFISQVYYDCRIMCFKDQSNYSGLDTSKIPPGYPDGL